MQLLRFCESVTIETVVLKVLSTLLYKKGPIVVRCINSSKSLRVFQALSAQTALMNDINRR